MTKERTPTSYLEDDWGMTPPGGTNASGMSEKAPLGDRNNPYRVDAPESPEWGIGAKEATSYGHSDDVKETNDYKAWGLDKDDVARGFERPGSGGAGEPGTASFEQSIPDTNVHDRGAGSDAYAREHSDTTGCGYDGRGQPKSTSNPGGETIGSSKLVG